MADANLAEVVSTERERLAQGLGITPPATLKSYEQIRAERKASWRRLFAAEAAQRRALSVAKAVAPLLSELGVETDVQFYEEVKVPSRRGRRHEPTRQAKTGGWVLRQQPEGYWAILDCREGGLGGWNKTVGVLDIDGDLHAVAISSAGLLKGASMNGITGKSEIDYREDRLIGYKNAGMSLWSETRMVGDPEEWIERVQWSPGTTWETEAVYRGNIADAAVPYMAGMLAVVPHIDLEPTQIFS